ncbi:MAG: GSCFA domain-containing protein [Chitinophagia bacterium]
MSSIFRLEFDPKPLEHKIGVGDKLMLMGSCFTEHIYDRLLYFKFKSLQNPHGILFNPFSIFTALHHYADQKSITEDELFLEQGIWRHWHFHSSLSQTEKSNTCDLMNASIQSGHQFLRSADWLIVTLGSSYVYHYENSYPVSNCHKVPLAKFSKKLMLPEEIIEQFEAVHAKVKLINPTLKWMFTISPVRHLRDGFVENNRSKAILIHAVDKICGAHPDIVYFPSYELILDDLRDYRFYAEDMVHPNYLATRYVWDKLVQSGFDGKSREVMKELEQINMAFHHKPMHPDSDEHQKFREKFKAVISDLKSRYPDMDLDSEYSHFC